MIFIFLGKISDPMHPYCPFYHSSICFLNWERFWQKVSYQIFLAAMSSSRSDIVTHAVRPSVRVLYFSIFALFFHAASYSLSRYTFLLAMSIETFHFALYESFLAALSSSRSDSVSNAVRTSVRSSEAKVAFLLFTLKSCWMFLRWDCKQWNELVLTNFCILKRHLWTLLAVMSSSGSDSVSNVICPCEAFSTQSFWLSQPFFTLK